MGFILLPLLFSWAYLDIRHLKLAPRSYQWNDQIWNGGPIALSQRTGGDESIACHHVETRDPPPPLPLLSGRWVRLGVRKSDVTISGLGGLIRKSLHLTPPI